MASKWFLVLLVHATVGIYESQSQNCDFAILWAGACEVTCMRYGINGNTQHPGEAAAIYLAQAFAENSASCGESWSLKIADSAFPNNVLDVNWLSGTNEPLPPITTLTLHSNNLQNIETGAFSSEPLSNNVRTLAIYGNPRLNEILAGMTQGLTALESFQWVSNGLLTRADDLALSPFYRTLQVLQINDCGAGDEKVLANMTGFCQPEGMLPSLLIMDMAYNPGPGLHILSRKHFSSLNRVLSMYIGSSEIQFMEYADVLQDIGDTLQTLDLSNNLLTTLPIGFLNATLEANLLSFTIMLQGNPWHCDCHLKWLQDIVNFAIGGVVLRDNPVCASPPSQAGKLFIEADLLSETCPPQGPDHPINISCD